MRTEKSHAKTLKVVTTNY